MKEIGIVDWFNNERGFGFINWSKDGIKQKDMFIHFSDILMNNFKTLKKDQKVMFSVGKNNFGEPKATEVEVVK